MSDEKRRIFTHPDIVQAGNYADQYNPGTRILKCTVCQSPWASHSGWSCPCSDDVLMDLPCRPATVTTTCARCSATIDPAAVEQHHERCFRVGDYVRWTNEYHAKWHAADPRWFEGVATKVYDSGQGTIGVGVLIERGSTQYSPGDHVSYTNAANLRHIQRPGQAIVYTQPGYNGVAQLDEKQPTLSARLGHLKHGPGGSGLSGPCDADCRKCQVERDHELQDAMEQPAPTLYDGLTLGACYRRWFDNRAALERGEPIVSMTTEQIAAAKSVYASAPGKIHSFALRARISAAKERERLSVTYCEVDVEDEPWK